MPNRTPLYQSHIDANAKMVDFYGWEMPLHYGSQMEEHHQVRQDAGVFDVSHMTIIDIEGQDAKTYLQYLLANDVAKLKEAGKALYACLLNEKGGVIDDAIIYFLEDQQYRLVVNSATREKDLVWINKVAADFTVDLTPRLEMAMIAVQGPQARERVIALLDSKYHSSCENLKPLSVVRCGEWFIARTGYTGEDGFEVMLPASESANFWKQCLAAGIHPCGLGACDTLRLEAGLNLYGQDMDETTSPLESNLAWTIAFEPTDRNFMGRQALEEEKERGVANRFVGLVLTERGVLRAQQKVIIEGVGEGIITSGTFSPTLGHAVALARIPAGPDEQAVVEVRNKRLPVRIVKPSFVKKGKKVFE